MNIRNFKRYAISLALAAGFVIAPGLSTVQAQWDRDGRYDRRDGRYDRRDGRYDRRDGRYDRRDGRYDRRQEQKGYRDGLDRGQKDAKTNRRADPNNSQHYREGSRDYREGFRSGYFQGYRQFARYRRRY
jgi:hypothetical protein